MLDRALLVRVGVDRQLLQVFGGIRDCPAAGTLPLQVACCPGRGGPPPGQEREDPRPSLTNSATMPMLAPTMAMIIATRARVAQSNS